MRPRVFEAQILVTRRSFVRTAHANREHPGIGAADSVDDPGYVRRGQGIVKRDLTVLAVGGKHDQSAQNARVTGDKFWLRVAIHMSVLSIRASEGPDCVGRAKAPR